MEPVTKNEPDGGFIRPILFESPHSGTRFPQGFDTIAAEQDLLTAWDAWVDELWAHATDMSATLISAQFPRVYIDPNRAADDIDPDLVEGDAPASVNPTKYSARGMGLIRRDILPGKPMYAAPLSFKDIERRLTHFYQPYHDAVADTLAAFMGRFGVAWHIDCHSMKSVGNAMNIDAGSARPDVVLGDLNGTSCDPAFTMCVADAFKAEGFSVAVNDPYAGGYLVAAYGDPSRGCHSLQIELNRRLYMDEGQVIKSGDFDAFITQLQGVTAQIMEFVEGALGEHDRR